MGEFGFVLKKFVTFFVEPLGLVMLLLFLGIWFLYEDRKKISKFFLTMGFSLLFLFSYPPFANFLVKNLENQYPKYDYSQAAEYIHVLGNGHNTDESQPISSHLSDGGTKRVLEGVIIHRNMPWTNIIFTGYEGATSTPNAIMNATLAKELGVYEDEIIINPNPKDTKEEAIFAKSVVGEKPFILVTSATHMPRAMMIFKSLGMHPIPAPTDFHKKEIDSYLKAPNIGSLEKSRLAIHEYLGILWSKIK